MQKSTYAPALRVLVRHIRWLEELEQPALFLAQLTQAKVQHFAAEARSLDAAEGGCLETRAVWRWKLLRCYLEPEHSGL